MQQREGRESWDVCVRYLKPGSEDLKDSQDTRQQIYIHYNKPNKQIYQPVHTLHTSASLLASPYMQHKPRHVSANKAT